MKNTPEHPLAGRTELRHRVHPAGRQPMGVRPASQWRIPRLQVSRCLQRIEGTAHGQRRLGQHLVLELFSCRLGCARHLQLAGGPASHTLSPGTSLACDDIRPGPARADRTPFPVMSSPCGASMVWSGQAGRAEARKGLTSRLRASTYNSALPRPIHVTPAPPASRCETSQESHHS